MEERFIELFNKIPSDKRGMIRFNSGYQHKIFITDKYFGLYKYTKGSHWNFGGSHYYYLFNLDGSFNCSVNGFDGLKEKQTQRVVKSFLENLHK